MQAKQSGTGYTLVELMVTLLVLAVLAMLATPTFNELIEKSRLRGATDDLVTLLNTSRGNAVKLQYDINVSTVGTGTTWCAGANSATAPANPGDPVQTAASCDCSSNAGCSVNGITSGVSTLVSSTDYSGVQLSSVSGNIKNSTGGIVFNSKFGALNPLGSTGTVTLKSKTQRFSTQITVAPLGQIYVCVPAGSPFISGYPSC